MNDGYVTLLQGDALTVLRDLPDGAAQMCVTSPPYWGLRDYGTATWEGGVPVGDNEECTHNAARQLRSDRAKGGLQGGTATVDASDMAVVARDYCLNCGARRIDSQLGLEKSPEEYVARMVAVFAEVRRVLRDDGTLWVNLGDSYARDVAKGGSGPNGKHDFIPDYGNARRIMSESKGSSDGVVGRGARAPVRVGGGDLKPKDLVGIPWLLAFALRADGWYLRSDIIWSKPNPMPESVQDRPTKSHEYLFLLSKRERYHYNADAIREAHEGEAARAITIGAKTPGANINPAARRMLPDGQQTQFRKGHSGYWGEDGELLINPAGRNKRSVWTIATEPYPEAHFATFPTALVKPCILAGCPEGGTVLDPFAGSGTTLQVAKELGRKSIGIELNPEYIALIEKRIARITTPFAWGEVS